MYVYIYLYIYTYTHIYIYIYIYMYNALFLLFQASEFFMFGCLMVVDMLLFAFLAYRFQQAEAAKKKEAGIDNLAADADANGLPMEERKKPDHSD
jgi:hypothetical protein